MLNRCSRPFSIFAAFAIALSMLMPCTSVAQEVKAQSASRYRFVYTDTLLLDGNVYQSAAALHTPETSRQMMKDWKLMPGGVSFSEHAATAPNADAQIRFSYDPAQKDGSRLQIIFDGKSMPVTWIHDWQLGPIAKWANTTNNSLVDVSDNDTDKAEFKRVRLAAPLQDTRVGLRIIQADLMPFNALEEPSEAGFLFAPEGVPALGVGEEEQKGEDCVKAAIALRHRVYGDRAALRDILHVDAVTSTDVDVQVTITKKPEGGTVVEGDPRIMFWSKGALQLGAVPAVPAAALSKCYEKNIDLYSGSNPAAWNVLTKTMKLGSLLRLAKLQDPKAFADFMSSIENVAVEKVATPRFIVPVKVK